MLFTVQVFPESEETPGNNYIQKRLAQYFINFLVKSNSNDLVNIIKEYFYLKYFKKAQLYNL